jgi:uncharacterized protein
MPNPPSATPTARYAPAVPFPPYSYVTGRFPHPVGDPRGHSFGQAPAKATCPPPEKWHDSQVFCFAVDLFNHGYYWESHEVWESLWHASGRSGTRADFLKALIKLAAAGVKAREGRPAGWRRHLRRAYELLAQTRQQIGPDAPRYFGLELAGLMAAVAKAGEDGPPADAAANDAVRNVFPFQLMPQ